ncbi:MAG: septum formation initiator family protein [Gemmatimonadetes bacterium]|nr:septum formation initiator family protein [Gemmatimonadota bacterium]
MELRRLVFPGVLGLAVYFAVAEGEYSLFDVRRAEAELEAREEELPRIQAENDSLRALIESLRSDDEALERFARERYGLVRDGEVLYRLSEPTEPPKEPH